MTDLIEIGVEVRTNSVRPATKEVDSLGKTLKSAERSASAFVDAFARQERQVSKAAAANKEYSSTAQKMYNEILKIDTATKSASASASVFAANLEKEARAAAQVAKENERLKNKFVEGHTAMNIYTKELNDLAIARERDFITSKEQKDAVAQLNAQMKAGTGVFANAATGMQIVGKRANRSGVLMQQAGYQFGDFAVQVQSGTNVMVAFGQQATQLIGTFSMLAKSTRMIALFSGLGVAVPILTAIGAAFMRTREANESANEKLRSTDDILKDLKSSVSDADKELRLLHSTFDDITKLEVVDQIKQLEEQIELIKTAGLESVTAFAEVLGASGSQLKMAGASVEALAEGKRLQIEQLQAVLDTLVGKQKLLEIEEGYNELLEEQNDALDRTDEKNNNVLRALRERAALAQAFIDGGEEAVELEENLREKMALVRELQSDQYDFSEAQISAILQQVLEVENLERQVQAVVDEEKAATEEAKRIAKETAEAAKAAEKLRKEFEKAAEAVMNINVSATDKLADLQAKLSGYTRGLTEDQVRIQTAARNAELAAREAGVDSALELAAISSEAAKIERETIAAEKALKEFTKTAKGGLSDAEKAAEAYAKALDGQVIDAIGGVADAWGDFVVRGFSDFKGFVSSVLNSFKSMLSNMIAMAAKNKIMLSLGIGGVGSGSVASAAGSIGGTAGNSILSGGGMLSGTAVGAGISAIGTGLSTGFMSSVYGGLGGMSGAISGGLSVGGLGGVATAIGAVAAPLLAVAAVFSFFKKSVKELDSGISATVTNMDSYVESFSTIQTKRFWGLSKKVSTNTTAMDADNPISLAIASVQQSIFSTAQYLGIATDSLSAFSYEFKLSLKGLSEEAKMQKIAEEVNKLGDAFANLLPNVSNMEHLTAIMNERYSLETRLLEAQGDTQALRERELANTNEYNRAILEQIFAAEDAKAALGNLNNSLKETDFATLLDFNRAKAYARLGVNVANSPEVPSMSNAATSGLQAITNPMNTASGEIVQLRSEMKEMHKEAMFAYSKLIKNGKDSRDTLRSWDVVGLPAERTA